MRVSGRDRAFALLIATDEYADETFRQLRSPPADVEALAEVLANPAIGGYEVRTLLNPEAHDARLAVEDLFADVGRNDLVLLYISGHGVKDDEGLLHFAMTNSRHNRLNATAVDSQFVSDRMHFTRSRRIVVCLDCCYAGAFPPGVAHRAADNADVLVKLAGKGRAVLTSSSALEYSYEAGDKASAEVAGTANPSIFTGSLVQGLRTGLADRNRDGLIDVDELYEYVHDQIRSAGAKQTPGLSSSVEGRLFVAVNPVPPSKAGTKAAPSSYRPEYAIPVARLASEVGQPWTRPRWGRVPRQPITHLVRPTTPDRLNEQLAAHLGDTVPHALVTGVEPVPARGGAVSGDLVDLLGRAVRAFVPHDGDPRRFRFQRYELVTWLLKQKGEWLLHSFADISAAGTFTAQRWLLRQPYLASTSITSLSAFAQRLLAAARGKAEAVHKLLVHAFLADLAEGYGRQLLWTRWARRDHYPVLLLRRLTSGTTGAELVRLVGEVREETGLRDPLLIIATGTNTLQELSNDEIGADHRGRRAGTSSRERRSYAPVLVSDQPSLSEVDQTGAELGVQAWRGHVRRPRIRAFFARRSRVLQYFQVLESACALLLAISAVSAAGAWADLGGITPPDPETAWLMRQIEDNNDEAERVRTHVTVQYSVRSTSELHALVQVQEDSLDGPAALSVNVLDYGTARP